jgi:hypothetical protein
MMKRFVIGLGLVVMAMVGAVSHEAYVTQKVEAQMQELRDNSTGSKWKVEEVAVSSDLSSVEPYMYVVAEIYGDEINGVSITHKTPDNGGVVLSYEYNNVPEVQTGDIVLVEYGASFDDVVSVEVVDNDDLAYEIIEEEMPHQVKSADGERFFLSEDGSYVGESFYY